MKIKEIEQDYLSLYPNGKETFIKLRKMIDTYRESREPALVERDVKGVEWIHSGDTVGIMLYVDLFSGDLKSLIKKSDYFVKLGITLIHLMPILKPRAGENDGGYAVASYREIDPRIGTMADFIDVVKHYHSKGIRLCIDYVVNHTADDHTWAQKALKGEEKYQNYYFFYEDESVPKAFEETMPEVFPKVAPGNFTYREDLEKWVMTTFYPFQWDLNYRNPDVFHEMVENLLFMANIGVDMIRLDAIPFMWKTLGTSCRNLPEVHTLLNLFRNICKYAAPSTALLGEAIMAPNEIVKYFGSEGKAECHSLYNASYMVELWNTLATRDTRHLQLVPTFNTPHNSAWINYARCHDDIGWGLDESRIRQLGFDPHAHKSFLIDFYLGSFEESFSIGELYEFNPETLDARNSGTLASLCGLEKALLTKRKYDLELALKRILLIHAAFIFRKGIPMIYSGDEIAQVNNRDYVKEFHKKHDSRWLHRQSFRWDLEGDTLDVASPQAVVFKQLREMIRIRKEISGENPIERETVFHQSNSKLFIVQQILKGTGDKILLIFNFSEDRQWLYTNEIKRYGVSGSWCDLIQDTSLNFDAEKILIGPYEIFVIKM